MALHLRSDGVYYGDFADHAGETSELLDDYEEGVWTAVLSTGGTVAGTASVMCYTKCGGVVTLHGQFRQGTSQQSGNLQLTALPYANMTNPTNGNALAVGALRTYQQALVTGYSNAGALVNVEGGASTMEFYLNTDNNAVASLGRDDNAYEAFTIVYRTD